MRTFFRVTVIVYVAYLAIALLLITPALNFLPHRYLHDTYGRELRTGWVLLNPFKLSLDISEAELDDDTGEPFLAFSEASVNLSLESLWQPGWVFDTVKLRDLYLNIERLTEAEYTFSDLLPDDTGEEPPASDDNQIPGLTIHELVLHSEAIVLTDQARETPYTNQWNGLNFRVTKISTVHAEGRPFSLDVEAEGGGKLHWEGEVSVPEGHSAGRLALSNLNLRQLWLFAQPWLQFELKEGQLSVEGNYELDWSEAFNYRISDGQIRISAIDIVPVIPDELADTALGLQTLDINNITLDSITQRVTIDSVALDDVAVATWREGSSISLEQLFVINLPEETAATAADDEENAGEKSWSVTLNKAQLSNSNLHWRSQLTDPERLHVQQIEASIEPVNWPLDGDSRLSLSLAVNELANIAVNGAMALAEGNGSLDYNLDGLPLTWFNPNLPEALKAEFTGGEIAVKGQVALHEYAPSTITLDGTFRDFSARQEDTETTLTGWDLVRVQGLDVDMEQHSLVLKKLTIDHYTGRLHINKDGSVNASNIWKEEVGEQAEQIAEELTEDKPWSFSIPTIEISDSEIDFMDESLPIVFRTVVGDMEGAVQNISSDSGAMATAEIKGSVDGYAPVSLTGTVAPFAASTDLDLNLTFNGVDMALLSPYSGTYAGYVIERGLLNLDLQYKLKDDGLQGNNSIRIEKLKLGEKIVSDKAVDLPLELALAILTDSNGVIDMTVPVAGDVNDPGFELGGVISQAFLNIITKAITAPFNLLASLVQSEEDLQRIAFSSGSTKLNDASREKLTQLASAMTQRPRLSLVITGRLNPPADRERLQRNALKVQLLEQGLTAEEIKTRGPDWEEAIAEMYEDLATSAEDAPSPTSRAQYKQVVQSIAISQEQMRALAEQRAVTVKSYLVTEAGLAADRAVVGQVTVDNEANDFSGVELGIE